MHEPGLNDERVQALIRSGHSRAALAVLIVRAQERLSNLEAACKEAKARTQNEAFPQESRDGFVGPKQARIAPCHCHNKGSPNSDGL